VDSVLVVEVAVVVEGSREEVVEVSHLEEEAVHEGASLVGVVDLF